jgi:hypothetical protein
VLQGPMDLPFDVVSRHWIYPVEERAVGVASCCLAVGSSKDCINSKTYCSRA